MPVAAILSVPALVAAFCTIVEVLLETRLAAARMVAAAVGAMTADGTANVAHPPIVWK